VLTADASAPAPAHDEESLRALLVASDAEVLRTLDQAIASTGDRTLAVMDLAEAVVAAQGFRPHVAFVDVTLGGGSGLALVHHLQAVQQEIAVYALAPPERVAEALEAVSLGAAGLLLLPTSGDAALRVTGEVRTRRTQILRVIALEEELHAARRAGATMQSLALEHGRGGPQALLAAAAKALVDVTGAHAASIYAEDGEVLDRASGHGPSTLPQRTTRQELGELASDAPRELVAHERLRAVIEGAAPGRIALAAEAIAFVSQLLALRSPRDGEDRGARFEPRARFEQLVAREVERSRRHRRQFSVASLRASEIAPSRGGRLEDVLRSVIRDGDVLGREPGDDEILIMLPDTGALGAQLCRRRLGVGPVGIATFPNDAKTAESILVASRTRRDAGLCSVVRALGLDVMGLKDVVAMLLDERGDVDAGVASPRRLDLPMPAALSLVQHACHETRRAGACSIVVASRSGVGLASAVREAAAAPGERPHLVEIDVERVAAAEGIEAVVVAAEHGTWACCGVGDGDRMRLAHAADPMLGDVLVQRLTELASQDGAR